MSGFYEDERIRHKNNKFADAFTSKKDKEDDELDKEAFEMSLKDGQIPLKAEVKNGRP